MQPQPSTCKHDNSFYFDDGSCILRVEDTLFNVHRSILSRDSSVFNDMFTLPQGSKAIEGKSDDNPITLAGDSVVEFKHFLWAIYALPSEIAAVSSGTGDLTLLIDIAQVANKYSFKSVETWALDAVYGRVVLTHQRLQDVPASPVLPSLQPSKPTPSPLDIPMDQLTRLLRLTQICNHEPLLETLVSILSQLTKISLHYAFKAMAIGDELNIPLLRGVSYLQILQKGFTDEWTMPSQYVKDKDAQPGPEKDSSPDEDLPTITAAQRTRLLAGYYRLSRLWERMRLAPPDFEHALACGATWHQHGCSLSWVEFWREKARSETVINLDVADVLGKLRHIQKEYDRLGNTTYMHHECREMAKKCLIQTIKDIEDNLFEFFTDPL